MKKITAFSFKKLLYNKNFIVTFSIVLAFFIWLTITMEQQTTMERTFSVKNVSINVENTAVEANGMSIIGDISQQNFTVRVRGTSSSVSRLTDGDIHLYASAAEVDSPGEKELTVYASAASASGYEVIEIIPSKVSVEFDYIDKKEFDITVQTDGITVPTESGLVKGTEAVVGLESNKLEITGPRAVVSKIDKVVALVDDTKSIISKENFQAEIVIYDAKSNILSKKNLSLSIKNVTVTVPVYKQKTVPVNPSFTNLPEGFDTESLKITLNHPTVLIEGTPEAVDKIDEIFLNPIDIGTLSKQNNVFELAPNLPEGIRIFDAIETFTVTVDLKNYKEKTLTVTEVEYFDVSSGLKATGAKSIRNVKICAPSNVINRITSKNTYAKIVLTDKKKGEYTVAVTICFKNYDTAWAIGSYKTTLTIK